MAIRTAAAARRRLAGLADPALARQAQRYFKTGPGEYAEGDVFRGIRAPVLRQVVRECATMPLGEALRLLRSRYHEDRIAALLVMVHAYARGDGTLQARIVRAYLANLEYVNNWDLVDCSAAQILGAHLRHRSRSRLHALARSTDVWRRRIAIIATAHFIRAGEAAETLRLAHVLLSDKHDLIHKAVGWMLREVGHRCGRDTLRTFLDAHAATMPRTMLRYALEHFAADERARYLNARAAGR
jgi:3-methyladenine DNA glycosylase AlkD